MTFRDYWRQDASRGWLKRWWWWWWWWWWWRRWCIWRIFIVVTSASHIASIINAWVRRSPVVSRAWLCEEWSRCHDVTSRWVDNLYPPRPWRRQRPSVSWRATAANLKGLENIWEYLVAVACWDMHDWHDDGMMFYGTLQNRSWYNNRIVM